MISSLSAHLKQLLFSASAIALATAAGFASGSENQLDYRIERLAGQTALYRISVTFKGDADGKTEIELPNEWGGQKELYKAINDLRISTAGASLTDTGSPNLRTISHRPGEELTIEYIIAQDFSGPLKNNIRYRPVVETSHLHWIGHTVWVRPRWNDSDKIDVTFSWHGLPKDWTLADSYGTSGRTRQANIAFDKLGQMITVAGDFRLTEISVAGKRVSVAMRGKWNFADAELAEMVRRVIASQREFWKDNSQERFLVTLVPLDEGPNAFSFGGTGLQDSFALFATPNAEVPRLRALLAHEYFHNWNPAALGKMGDPEQHLYWFSEGFTEFYTYRLLYRSGIISEAEFIETYNSLIREYYMLPARNEPNERIVRDFWNDSSVGRLPYLRGLMFATNLNAEIMRVSGGTRSLDDVMFDLAAAHRERPQTITIELLRSAFQKHLGFDPANLIERQIIKGEMIVPLPDALGPTVTLENVEIPIFELGFDFDKFAKERIVEGVAPGSAAFDAGLRNGQTRNGGVSIRFGDTSTPLELKVKDGVAEKVIKFVPVAKTGMVIPQFRKKQQ